MEFKRFFIAISGPTGVGKTDIVNKLAEYIDYPVEIINADMGQFYEPISIGTAKPNWRNEAYRQHLFDILREPKNFTTFDYREKAKELIIKLWNKKVIPIVVGGSSFYINSLFYSQDHTVVNIGSQKENNEENNKEWSKSLNKKSNQELWQELYKIDSVRAEQLHYNDRYRVERALTLWYKTSQLPSKQKPEFDPFGDFYMIFLTRDRQELYSRINNRVIDMIDAGWIKEVQSLNQSWREFLIKKNLIGYPEIIDFLNNQDQGSKYKELEKLVSKIQKKTRNYAKRQITFWRSFSKNLKESLKNSSISGQIEEINLTGKDQLSVVKNLSLEIKKEIK